MEDDGGIEIPHTNDEESKATKVAKELKKDQRQLEQLDVDPEEVLKEQEKRQPQSLDE
jgi:hypothetical protein